MKTITLFLKVMHKANHQHGNILLVTVISMFIMVAFVMTLLMVTTNAIHLSNKQQMGTLAFNIAESGAEQAILWLRDQATPPSGTSPILPFGESPQTMENGTYSVVIYPDPNNPSNYLKQYRIVSTGTANGQRKIIEVVVKQASFGRYAYFTDRETSSVSGGAIWWKAGELVDGPVHSNNTGGSNFNINYNGSKSPIFLDMVTGAGSTINYSPSRPKNETTFRLIFANGSKGFKLGVDPILLPPSTDNQKIAAWGSTTGFPTSSSGVWIRSNMPGGGGIYICGDCTLQLSIDTSGNQQFTIKQGSNTTVVTLNKATGTTTYTGPVGSGSAPSGSPIINGVIYCSGNITSLKGVIADNLVNNGEITYRSAFTIATDTLNGKDITITDNLYYNTRPDKTKSITDPVNLTAGTLGLVARNIIISSSAPANLEIDGVMLAGGQTTDGSFYVANYSTKTPTGTLKVIGGIIQKSRGPVGTFDSSSGVTKTGYAKNYSYDPRLAEYPPPYYPTTGQYERVSWRVLPDTN